MALSSAAAESKSRQREPGSLNRMPIADHESPDSPLFPNLQSAAKIASRSIGRGKMQKCKIMQPGLWGTCRAVLGRSRYKVLLLRRLAQCRYYMVAETLSTTGACRYHDAMASAKAVGCLLDMS